MPGPAVVAKPRGLALMFGWQRVAFTLAFSMAIGLLMGLGWESGLASILIRTIALGLIAMVVFGVFEQWPKRLPRWLGRWALQVVTVAIAMPISTAVIYDLSTDEGAPHFWEVEKRLQGFGFLTGMSVFLAPWVALGALVRQREAFAREQALAFDLERSEYERQALDARLHLLQAQVAPHFLFNTLANVQALVDAGSPQASAVLRSLVAYLRAAVPRINEPATTIGQELTLVKAYLELMHMRMPDRLKFEVHADPAALALRCPPMTILTLVENAVRHGIDPSEDGGSIEIRVERRDNRCMVRVSDSGLGLRHSGGGLGTGLATLRERLQLVFGNQATLSVAEQRPRGVRAELDMPAQELRT
jgi:signal transduction histidine kinase